MKKTIKKNIRIKLIIALFIMGLFLIFSGFNIFNKNEITGKVVDLEKCNYSEPIYDGTFVQIVSPLNNSYVGNTPNLTIISDYYGTREEPNDFCELDDQGCSLSISVKIQTETDVIQTMSFNAPITNEGNKTYTNNSFCLDEICPEGNYSIYALASYTCSSLDIYETTQKFAIHKEFPKITEIYPTNNLKLNISTNTTTTIFPKLTATDSLGILNRTIYDGNKIISLIDNPNYNITLSPGTYTWNFTATDLAGNIDMVTASFTIFNSSTNITNNIINQTNITSNATIYFDSKTTENNKLTNSSLIFIKIITNSTETSTNLTLKIFNSDGQIIYQNSTTEKTLEKDYTFISDGIYFYNATFSNGDEMKTTPTRKITIDTQSPTITIVSPKNTQTEFINSALIDFTAEDDNGIARRWINDGTKNTDYTTKINRTLEEGFYTWTVYAQDEAGNIAKETIKFSIIEKKSTNKVALFIIILASILLIILIIIHFLMKKSKQPQPISSFPPANPSMPFNRPIAPQNPQIPLVRQMNPAMFKNNAFQQQI